MLCVLLTCLATNQVVASCMNTNFWLDKITQSHAKHGSYATCCKKSLPWASKMCFIYMYMNIFHCRELSYSLLYRVHTKNCNNFLRTFQGANLIYKDYLPGIYSHRFVHTCKCTFPVQANSQKALKNTFAPLHSKLRTTQGRFKDWHRHLRTFQGKMEFKDFSRTTFNFQGLFKTWGTLL